MKPIKDKLYWLFPKDTVPNSLIQDTLTQLQDKDKLEGRIGKGNNDDMRQVQKIPMDEFDPLSVLLYGYARKANDLIWNYDLVGPCQFEMLYYECSRFSEKRGSKHFESSLKLYSYKDGE